jgi:hypothetical protein
MGLTSRRKRRFTIGAASNVGSGGGVVRAVVIGLCIVLAASGCSVYRAAARALRGATGEADGAPAAPGSGPLKKIVLMGLEQAPLAQPGDFATHFQNTIGAFLRKQCRIGLIDPGLAERLKSPPRLPSGQIDGFALALLGRQEGVNFFVFGSLADVQFREEKTGFWLWKDTRYAIRVVVRFEAVDSASGSKALDESLWEEVTLDELTYQQMQQAGPVRLADIQPAISKLFNKAGYRACEALGSQPWRGFVTDADAERFTISTGSSCGLSTDRELAVFAMGAVIEGKGNSRFIEPGEPSGEARVVTVTEDRSEAVCVSAGCAAKGATVRIKR